MSRHRGRRVQVETLAELLMQDATRGQSGLGWGDACAREVTGSTVEVALKIRMTTRIRVTFDVPALLSLVRGRTFFRGLLTW
jgi:hypothetical protein